MKAKGCEEYRLLECFSPEEEFTPEHILCCSYGTHPSVILALMLRAFGEVDESFFEGIFSNSAKERLRSTLKNGMEKLIVLTDKAPRMITDPEKATPAEFLLTDHICELSPPSNNSNSCFHPKMILITYRNPRGLRKGKIYIGSKNLTHSKGHEFGVVLDLKRSRRKAESGLIGFLESLLKEDGSDKSHFKIKSLIDSLASSRLDLPPEYSLLFQTRFGVERSLGIEIAESFGKCKHVHIHSPWIKKTALDLFAENFPKSLSVRCLPLANNKAVVRSSTIKNVSYTGELTSEGRFHYLTSHAKIFYGVGEKKKRTLFFGSANSTKSGLGLYQREDEYFGNTEVMLKLELSSSGLDRELKINNKADTGDGQVLLDDEKRKNREDILQGIGIDIVHYDVKSKSLIYNFFDLPNRYVTFTHYLIEPYEGVKAISFKLKKNMNTPHRVEYFGPIHLVSNYCELTIEDGDKEYSVDQVLNLEPIFYESRSDLSQLQYFKLSKHEAVTGLYEILGITVGEPGVRESCENNSDGRNSQRLSYLLENFPLDRLALKVKKLSLNDVDGAKKLIDRVIMIDKDLAKVAPELHKDFSSNLSEVLSVSI